MIQEVVEAFLAAAVQRYMIRNKVYGKLFHLVILREDHLHLKAAEAMGLARRGGFFYR